MKNLRKYGDPPFRVAVVHGGPGAPGGMAPVAKELSKERGVLEPLQTKASIGGQIQELKEVLERNGDMPITLIGHSWGAWLVFIFASYYPEIVKKIILVGSGPFEEKYVSSLMKIRLSRLSKEEKSIFNFLMQSLDNPKVKNKNKIMAQFGKLMSKIDSYNPLPHKDEIIEVRYKIYQKVWSEASQLRASGKLLELGKKIKCPVIAIHGDFEPHSSKGIKEPLSRVLKNFHFILLKKCGHYPWFEKEAKDQFYSIIKKELS